VTLHGEKAIISSPNINLDDHRRSTAIDCVLNTFADTLHIWRTSSPDSTSGRQCCGDRRPFHNGGCGNNKIIF